MSLPYVVRSAVAALLLAMALGPAPAQAQPPGSEAQALPSSPAEIQRELMEVQKQLVDLEERAMAEPRLVREREAIEAELERALVEADPTYPEKVKRMEAIVQELQAKSALSATDEQMLPLVQEGQKLQEALQEVQSQILKDARVSDRIERFHAQVRERMVQIEPKTDQLIERADRLLEAMRRQHGS